LSLTGAPTIIHPFNPSRFATAGARMEASWRTMSFTSSNTHRSTQSAPSSIFGKEEYTRKHDGPDGHADPDGPPVPKTVTGGPGASFHLPKASITALRDSIEE
jgi:hypothetical protein